MTKNKLELTVKPESQNPAIFLLIAIALMVGVGIFAFSNGLNNGQQLYENQALSIKDTAQMANPASTNCIDKGGTLTITPDQIGMCELPTGKICEEWALFRDEC